MALYKLVFNFNFNEEGKKTQVLQQEAYPAIWPPVDAQNSAIPGAIPQNGRRPVRDVVKPPCKISRQSAKPRLKIR